MIRCIHNQTVSGAILVDDIDDGLPNKEVHRLGSTADPKAYVRDGYANKPKQPCYIQYSHTAPNGSVVPGFITLQQTDKVTLSAGKGKIYKLSQSPKPGLITVVTGLTASQFLVPTVTASVYGTDPVVTTGTTFLSVTPDVTTISFTQGGGVSLPTNATGGAATFTTAQIIAGSGSVSATIISIPAAMFTQVPVLHNLVTVTSNEQKSNTFTMT
jgi:hypothetical protein